MISPKLELYLNKAVQRANTLKHEYLCLENVLLAIIEDETVRDVLSECEADIEKLKEDLDKFLLDSRNFSILNEDQIDELNREQFSSEQLKEIARQNGILYQPEISMALQRVIQRSALHVQSSGKKVISPINLLVSMYSEKESHAVYFLLKQDIKRLDIVEKIAHSLDRPVSDSQSETSSEQAADPLKQESKYEKALKDFTTELTQEALDGKLDPTIGRSDEIRRMIQVLCRRRKNNPILVGDSGVGKTTIAEGLAQEIINGNVPESLKGAKVYSLDMASLLAGTKFRGDFEERLKLVLNALDSSESKYAKVLFIDEIHTIIGAGSTAGGSLDASNLLKPALGKGLIRCIGSTTYDEYRRFFEKDQALSRRFQKIDVNEPSIEDTVAIIEGLKVKFEDHHHVKYTSDVIQAAVELAEKHISDRKLPDKAIDVIDEVGAYISMLPKETRHEVVSLHDIEKIISMMARIPEKSVSGTEKERLRNLKNELQMLIYGQDQAVEAVTNAIILSRSGLTGHDRPIASFLFAGPTGVGKTELAKQLSNIMGIHFFRVDMSEYMEKHSVSKLIGAPPGYVGYEQGGILTDAVNKNPYSVVLLDEIEKAHPDVFNILLQVMDHGKLTDSNGRSTDFRNVVLIMTSNAGAKEYEAGSIGLGSVMNKENTSKRDQALKNVFTPEFRNRLDAVIHFNKLTEENMLSIVGKFLMEVENSLLDKNIEIIISDEVRRWLAEKGFDPKLGARPIRRIIDEQIKKPLAQEILFGDLKEGAKLKVEMKEDKIYLQTELETA